jgi:hypothetical protein
VEKTLVDRLDSCRDDAMEFLKTAQGYDDCVKFLAKLHADDNGCGRMDPERITRIDHGDYQGTIVYVVGADGYQPYDHWYVKVGYGSCSGCDAWEGVCGYSDNERPVEMLEGLYEILHGIASGFRLMNDGDPVA